MFDELRNTLSLPFFGLVNGVISHWALTEAFKQKRQTGRESESGAENLHTDLFSAS